MVGVRRSNHFGEAGYFVRSAVDAGMIAAFLAFGLPGSTVFVSVLTYRVIAFWLPIPPGIVAYFQLRRTVGRWRTEETPA